MLEMAYILTLSKYEKPYFGSAARLGCRANRTFKFTRIFGDSFDIVHSWVGRDGEKQDFNFTQSRLEVKSSRPSSSHYLRISSEEQLAVSMSSPIYLCHTILEKPSRKMEFYFPI